MKRFNAFVIKEFYHILRDWQTLLILIGMPIAQILLFGFAISNEIKEVKVAIIDPVKSQHTRNITEKILTSEYFTATVHSDTPHDIEDLFQKGLIRQAIIFDSDFETRLARENVLSIQIVADATDPNTATLIYNYTQAILGGYVKELNQQKSIPFIINVESKMLYNPMLKGVFLFVPGTISVILMLISAMMTSISITREKELGTMEILLATPMAPAQIILAKVVPYLLLAFTNAVIILIMGYYIFGVPINGSLPLLLAETLLFVITALSLGIFISSKTSSQQVALMASLMGLMLPTILLSGFMFPIKNMPIMLQIISNIVPARWFIIIIKDIMIKGQGIEFFWKETLILVGFTVVFVGASIKSFKLRLS